MIRSFDYAAVAAVRQLAETRPRGGAKNGAAAPKPGVSAAVDGFRAAYRKTMRGCAAYPASKKQAREMTAFFLLEKAVYEVVVRTREPARPGSVSLSTVFSRS